MMKRITGLFGIAALLMMLTAGKAFSETWADIYQTNPDVASCSKGMINETQRMKVVNEINKLRTIHGMAPVSYDMEKEPNTQQGTLMCVANNTISHTPPSSWFCYTADGYNGTENSNLYIRWAFQGSSLESSIMSIVNWMIDESTETLGHRLAIINPFVTKVSFGRVDGTPKTDNKYFTTSMALYYRAEYASSIDVDYVAYPFHDYPPEHVDKTWFLSFSAFYDKAKWSNNSNVDISKVKIEVIPEGFTSSLNTHSYGKSNNWGSVGNCLRWKTDDLLEEVKYTVNIKGLIVNGQSKDYTYWFKLTSTGSVDIPKAPLLTTPSNNATNQKYNVSFKWGSSVGATEYKLQLSKSNQFTTNIIDQAVIGTTFDYAGLEKNMTYYWRVNAKNTAGESPWSTVYTFKTGNFTPPPAAPALSKPDDDARDVELDVDLSWAASAGATSYKLQLSEYDDFKSIYEEHTTTKTTYKITKLTYDTEYFWRVAAINTAGQSAWSTPRKFKTRPENSDAPALPLLGSPANNSTNVNRNAKLIWSASQNAQNYYLQVSTDPEFINDVINELTTDNYFTVIGLKANTTYYWHVTAMNSAGNSGFTDPWQFTTGTTAGIESVFEDRETLTNYPNPFSESTLIVYNILKAGNVTLSLFDAIGNTIKVLASGFMEPGEYRLPLESGNLPQGVYYYQLRTTDGIYTNKLEIVK